MIFHATHLLGVATQVNSSSQPEEEFAAVLFILFSVVKSLDPGQVLSAAEKALQQYRASALS